MGWIGIASAAASRRSLGLSVSLLLACGSGLTWASPLPDLLLLRDVICHQRETQGCGPGNKRCPRADWAVDTINYRDFGVCQISSRMAYDLGFFRHRDPALLFKAESNKSVALEVLAVCSTKYTTVKGLAFCYSKGLNAGKVNPDDPYVVAVSAAYGKKLTERK